MKKHNMSLSYKDLYAIKHALMWHIETKRIHVKDEKELKDIYKIELSDERLAIVKQYEEDIEYDTNLLGRITERISSIKDKYKIQ